MFTRRHYEKLARMVREHGCGDERLLMARTLGRLLAADNPRFNLERFYAACSREGVPKKQAMRRA